MRSETDLHPDEESPDPAHAPVDGPADAADPADAEKKSRAGRNLPAAIGVGVSLAAVVVLSLFLVKEVFLGVVVVALAVGLWELGRAVSTVGIKIPVLPVAVGGSLMVVSAYVADLETASVAMSLTVIGILVWRLSEGPDGFVRDATAGIFSLSYLFLMGTFVALMLSESDGAWRIVAFLLAAIASDTGGYIAGVLFGKHPMAPTISPKKSWEGLAGSFVGAIGVSIAVVVLALDGPWWAGVVLGAVGVVLGTLGDLLESLIKRDLGIKDMGNLLPGHGGLMDRLDSLVAVAPFAWLVLYTLVPAT